MGKRVKMCSHCRQRKVKCESPHTDGRARVWVEGGLQEKCKRCEHQDLPCGLPQFSNEQSSPRPPDLAHQASTMNSGSLIERRVPAVRAGIESDPAGPSVVIAEDKAELERKLNRVEILAELSRILGEKYMVALALQFPSSDNTENHELCATIAAIKSERDSEILELLPLALQLADALDFVGDLDAAENAYRRILDIYRPMGRNNWYNVKRLLRKLAKLSWKKGNDQLAQNFAWDALSWREVPPQANQSDLELLKDLGRSLSRTSSQLSDIIRSTPVGSNSEMFNASVPPLQRMIEGTYASNVDGNPFATAELPKDNLHLHPPLQHPVVGGFNTIMELLKVFPSADLHARDSNGRSPLYLSGSLRKECFGFSLIMYVKNTEGSTQSLVNSRDHSGQTVLGISVLNGCSIAFITALVQNGAEVNPDTISLAWTPLQAAAWVGSLEVVELLLGHGAIVDNVFPGSESPQYLAQQRGHFDLARRLDRSSSGSSGSSSAQRGTRS